MLQALASQSLPQIRRSNWPFEGENVQNFEIILSARSLRHGPRLSVRRAMLSLQCSEYRNSLLQIEYCSRKTISEVLPSLQASRSAIVGRFVGRVIGGDPSLKTEMCVVCHITSQSIMRPSFFPPTKLCPATDNHQHSATFSHMISRSTESFSACWKRQRKPKRKASRSF